MSDYLVFGKKLLQNLANFGYNRAMFNASKWTNNENYKSHLVTMTVRRILQKLRLNLLSLSLLNLLSLSLLNLLLLNLLLLSLTEAHVSNHHCGSEGPWWSNGQRGSLLPQ